MAEPIRLTKGVHTHHVRSSLSPGRTNRVFAALDGLPLKVLEKYSLDALELGHNLPSGWDMTRHVIRLPKRKDEADFKVEVIIGGMVRTDAINYHFFSGTLETENIPGWGFDRYVLRKLGPMATSAPMAGRRA